ncbi:MSC_0882 family membrane protein [Mycoplasma miroungirhinis]|uniref:Uncharacterized protein n=1 Tax=Mycoplasma miroungirhinis TaxID=754516 RepID=A0A6M4JH94_9MOLU|nr:hypothetical protein [Mycoplasma miroungirhinis]QJR44392.1 hypothetical protein HLA92_03055 [Mycoplasma miroungirhinis]
MELQPWNKEHSNQNKDTQQTATLSINNTIESKYFESTETKDPEGFIPNSIMRIYKWETVLKIYNIIIICILLATSTILVLLLALKPSLFKLQNTPWVWYILLGFFMLIMLWKLINDLIELSSLKKSIKDYRDTIKREEKTTPAFIVILYRQLTLRQISHNWITIAFTFYFGIFTLIFWAIKDSQWIQYGDLVHKGTNKPAFVLDFKEWINYSFPNPTNWVYVFSSIIIFVIIIHIIWAIFRKIRITNIRDSFGLDTEIIQKIQEQKSKQNRFYAKIFLISILLVLILPFIIYIFTKKIFVRKRG